VGVHRDLSGSPGGLDKGGPSSSIGNGRHLSGSNEVAAAKLRAAEDLIAGETEFSVTQAATVRLMVIGPGKFAK
jgi:hypothetical protein